MDINTEAKSRILNCYRTTFLKAVEEDDTKEASRLMEECYARYNVMIHDIL